MGLGFHFGWDQRGISTGGNSVSIGKEMEGAEFVRDKDVWKGRVRSKHDTVYSGR